jgi:hypothetical protein
MENMLKDGEFGNGCLMRPLAFFMTLFCQEDDLYMIVTMAP